ncbi:heavy metal translocating P-type ATPase [Caldithrix abyssi DSM 13497]|uniref:P-type Zn(2+) transporter n=1 Tax=Caldithrix abyssi DSM 13497 TaxID=880073 RepID=H1XY06_CALAY|nr:heavy metal translocating P-type ATPase [Caldithrix abyssi]APF20616.1 Cd2+/Zn2+-exporting ATPase [Caldithrix abyssi DSM 13497]EHO40881.1 heavy metal translocating P-type ATPase [Caldithrix abyssi DSM 13497]
MKQHEPEGFHGKWYSHPPMRNALIAGAITGVTFALSYSGLIAQTWEIALYVIAMFIGGYHWTREGFEKLIEEKEIGIEMLMIAATIGSAILGMWDEAAFLVFLYGAAEGLEEYTYAKTRASIRKLLDLAPKEAHLLRNGKEETVPAETLKVGDIFLVRPGESIPTDGIVIKGRSSVNEAPVTGESTPVVKEEGQPVFAATMNQEGALEIRATATFQDNTLAKMIHLVEEAQEQKGKAQAFIERFGRRYSPLVLVSALLMIIVPYLLGASLSFCASRAVVLLVAAAPCALIMSTPVALAAGIGTAGKNGVLIKGGVHLENLGKLKAIAFDKTGTLTMGKPVITDIVPANGSTEDLLQIALSIERLSEHPLARAIVQKAEELNIKALEVSEFKSIAGYGARAKINGKFFVVGRPELMGNNALPATLESKARALREQAKTVIVVGNDHEVKGLLAVRDEIRPGAVQMIEELHRLGIKVAILTGDNEQTAQAIARELKVDDVRASLKPENKMDALKDLLRQYGAVAMVGDGINDAPALAQATVGFAMGAAGTDAAIEAADIALMGDDLAKIPFALRLGKKVRIVSTENIVFSLLVLLFLIPTAVAGMMSVATAVFFHEASELLAVGNGLRAGKIKNA